MVNKRRVGSAYEEKAASYLEGKGFTLIERNYYAPEGEIDLIASCGAYIVFIEVKARSSRAYGLGREAVTAKKQRRISACAMRYLIENALTDRAVRFDVVEFDGGVVSHIPNAFEYCGS